MSKKNFYDETHTVFGHHENKLLQWIFSIDHKRIAILYMVVMFTFFIVALGVALTMRLELFFPGETSFKP